MLVATVIVIAVVAFLFWKWGPRRPQGPGFKFVYVNQDGSVRELSPEERDYLSRKARFELIRKHHLEQERRREALAKV